MGASRSLLYDYPKICVNMVSSSVVVISAIPSSFFLSAALIKPFADCVATEYFVSVGTAQVPSPRRKEACLPAAGAGTNPAAPAADDVAPFILL